MVLIYCDLALPRNRAGMRHCDLALPQNRAGMGRCDLALPQNRAEMGPPPNINIFYSDP